MRPQVSNSSGYPKAGINGKLSSPRDTLQHFFLRPRTCNSFEWCSQDSQCNQHVVSDDHSNSSLNEMIDCMNFLGLPSLSSLPEDPDPSLSSDGTEFSMLSAKHLEVARLSSLKNADVTVMKEEGIILSRDSLSMASPFRLTQTSPPHNSFKEFGQSTELEEVDSHRAQSDVDLKAMNIEEEEDILLSLSQYEIEVTQKNWIHCDISDIDTMTVDTEEGNGDHLPKVDLEMSRQDWLKHDEADIDFFTKETKKLEGILPILPKVDLEVTREALQDQKFEQALHYFFEPYSSFVAPTACYPDGRVSSDQQTTVLSVSQMYFKPIKPKD